MAHRTIHFRLPRTARWPPARPLPLARPRRQDRGHRHHHRSQPWPAPASPASATCRWRSAPLQASVFGAQQLDDAGVDVASAASTRLDASIGDAYNAEGYWSILSVRGYTLDNRSNYRRDGLPINAETAIALDNKDRLELLKGTSGIQAGTSAPGGLVNLVVKRPDRHACARHRSGARAGSVLAAVDLGDRFGTDGAFGLRLNAAYEQLRPAGARRRQGHRSLLAARRRLAGSAPTRLLAGRARVQPPDAAQRGRLQHARRQRARRQAHRPAHQPQPPALEPAGGDGRRHGVAALAAAAVGDDWRLSGARHDAAAEAATTARPSPTACTTPTTTARNGATATRPTAASPTGSTSATTNAAPATRWTWVSGRARTGAAWTRTRGRRAVDALPRAASRTRSSTSTPGTASAWATSTARRTRRHRPATPTPTPTATNAAPSCTCATRCASAQRWQLWAGLRHTRLQRESERTSPADDGPRGRPARHALQPERDHALAGAGAPTHAGHDGLRQLGRGPGDRRGAQPRALRQRAASPCRR